MDEIGADAEIHEIPERTKEDISAILTQAKVEEDECMKTTQVLYITGENSECDRFKILELDDHLHDMLKTNQNISFKGLNDDFVVLCTDTRTYEVRESETSNSLLLIPDLEFSKDLKTIEESTIKKKFIAGINYTFLEVTPSKPQLEKLLLLLEKMEYKGSEKEFEYNDTKLYTFEELYNDAQASRSELNKFLKTIDAITINGYVRVLDMDYHFRVLSFLLKSIDENSWQLDEIRKDITIDAWCELIPREILVQIFDIYTEKVGDDTYKYKDTRVCQFFARILLHYASSFNCDDFFQAWRESVPEGMMVKEEMLYGIAIVDREKNPKTVWYFPENKLPEDTDERFEALFDTKAKWTEAEISPYIENLTTDKIDVHGLLARFARAHTIEGVRYYSAKHE